MDATAERCWATDASIAVRASTAVCADNAAVAEITAKASRTYVVPIIISLESEASPADVIGEGRKAVRQWR